jgi:hypothetical protein
MLFARRARGGFVSMDAPYVVGSGCGCCAGLGRSPPPPREPGVTYTVTLSELNRDVWQAVRDGVQAINERERGRL